MMPRLLLLLVPLSLLSAACSSHRDVIFVEGQGECLDERCVCEGTPLCLGECAEPGCNLECHSGDRCEVSCGDDCLHACHDVTRCATSCGDGCALSCARVSSCDIDSGIASDLHCEDASNCAFVVGPESTVSCQRVGDCNVLCDGPCRVSCESVGNCDVFCTDHDAPADVCPDGRTRVCDEPC
jgi:hypothetical protein